MVQHFPVGTVFTQLTISGPPQPRQSSQGHIVYYYPCRCTCGKEKLVIRGALSSGLVKSCGCLAIALRTKHNACYTRLYNIWKAMRQRCELPTRTSFEHYGGKGISVCAEWQTFEGFAAWAKQAGYAENLSIDRIDANGNYEPVNCRWITGAENARRAHTKHGKIQCIETGEVFKDCRNVVVARTDAGSLYADASSILKSAKFGKCAHGKHYKFVTE